MMRTKVEGDNGESKLVFVLRSRHEALVGTMGDPLLCTVGPAESSLDYTQCQCNYTQRKAEKYTQG